MDMMAITDKELQTGIEKGLAELMILLDDDDEKIRAVIRHFVEDAPGWFTEIEHGIRTGDRNYAAAIIHKAKASYGYIGLDQLMSDLTRWELELTSCHTDQEKQIQHFQRINNTVVRILLDSPIYKATGGRHQKKPPFAGKHVLVMEDNARNAMVFELFIQELGAEVTVAATGKDAVRKIMDTAPDLIFMEARMPFCNGPDAIRELRTKGIKTPIIALAASPQADEERVQAMQAGADDFFVKPINRQALHQALWRYIGPVSIL
jgi:CheY-like chemotaxis protein